MEQEGKIYISCGRTYREFDQLLKEEREKRIRIGENVFTIVGEYSNDPKFLDRQISANIVDPDQCSGSTLFAILSASFGHITLW